MKLCELFNINNTMNTANFLSNLTKKYENYPKGSLSKREVVHQMEIKDIKKAEQICQELNDEVTKTLMKFCSRYK
jgi:hypothetical protein